MIQSRDDLALLTPVKVIQGVGQGNFHKGGFVLDGYTVEFHLMVAAIEALQQGFGKIKAGLSFGDGLLCRRFSAGGRGHWIQVVFLKKIGGLVLL
jgi:hypothetical protein